MYAFFISLLPLSIVLTTGNSVLLATGMPLPMDSYHLPSPVDQCPTFIYPSNLPMPSERENPTSQDKPRTVNFFSMAPCPSAWPRTSAITSTTPPPTLTIKRLYSCPSSFLSSVVYSFHGHWDDTYLYHTRNLLICIRIVSVLVVSVCSANVVSFSFWSGTHATSQLWSAGCRALYELWP